MYSESARFNCLSHGMVGLLYFALCSVSMDETKPFLQKNKKGKDLSLIFSVFASQDWPRVGWDNKGYQWLLVGICKHGPFGNGRTGKEFVW